MNTEKDTNKFKEYPNVATEKEEVVKRQTLGWQGAYAKSALEQLAGIAKGAGVTKGNLESANKNFIQERFSVNGAKKDWREIGKMAYEKAGKTLSSRTDTSIKRTIKSILKKYSDKDRGGRKLIFDAIQDEELKNRIAADLNNAEIFKIILENGFNT